MTIDISEKKDDVLGGSRTAMESNKSRLPRNFWRGPYITSVVRSVIRGEFTRRDLQEAAQKATGITPSLEAVGIQVRAQKRADKLWMQGHEYRLPQEKRAARQYINELIGLADAMAASHRHYLSKLNAIVERFENATKEEKKR